MESARPLPDHTVVVANGRITAVGPTQSVATEGADVIDATGMTVLPGLADMHVHFVDATDAWMYLANGVTRVRNMWGSPDHLAFRGAVRRKELPGPHMITTSPIVDGLSPLGHPTWPGSVSATDPGRVHALVGSFARRGYDQVKAYSLLKRDVLAALGAASADAGLRLVGHCPNGISVEQAVEAGMTCIEHLTSIQTGHLRQAPEGTTAHPSSPIEAMRIQAERLDLEAIARLAGMLAERQIWNCPTLVVNQAVIRRIEEAMADPNLRYQSATRLASWDPRADFRRRQLVDRWDAVMEAGRKWLDALFEVTRILHRAGAPILLGTDTPNPFVNQGFSVHRELANMLRCGFNPYEALSTATVDAARFMSQQAEWGTIAEGRAADLIAVRGDPLEDLAVLSSPTYVLVNGWVLNDHDLRSLLAQRELHAGNTPSAPQDFNEASGAVREGSWVEHVGPALSACSCHSHRRLPSRDIEVHEALDGENLTRRAHFILGSDLTLKQGAVETINTFGNDSVHIDQTEKGYRIRTHQVDSFELLADLETEPLVPSEKLAPSVLPAIVAPAPYGESTSIAALSVDGGTPTRVDIAIGNQGPPIPSVQGAVSVIVARTDDPSYMRIKTSADGNLEELSEMTIWGLRIVKPIAD
jgi:imidazolonepropionase-like amidohydrolase